MNKKKVICDGKHHAILQCKQKDIYRHSMENLITTSQNSFYFWLSFLHIFHLSHLNILHRGSADCGAAIIMQIRVGL